MDGFDTRDFGDVAAEFYDTHLVRNSVAPEDQIATLRSLCRPGGTVLDAGAGTGRTAVPLAAAGLQVTALDVSTAMLDRLRERAAGAGVAVTVRHGDMAAPAGADRYDLITCLFNTFYMLGGHDRQRAALRALGDALTPHGRLVLEVFNPTPEMFGAGSELSLRLRQVTRDSVTLVARRFSYDTRTIDVQEIVLTGDGMRLVPHEMVYLAPEDLDAMAADCGLTPAERWSDWQRTPWKPDSPLTVAVFVR
ncbi:bifunctional 2-polyprenyl-6-hydroxyphenol methylase/3-demethylubiquinol 3-O-methyltransferase UbiG [Actinoplanes sp. N902-109]|uniref:class I SAM-dependent methyltransferase n=1 Tax=Actinoplanes sp. (strain N902-109) TaxID=649831 RepID=UPI0003293E32|nr:class I SAM-dependent methyltransferase [Actinoplanes sp. N902-109]AGL18998.1 type 11 methyltransferase [Actinoplanes sp. N902-109]